MERPRYGFVGLGNLGGHLAARLIAKGFDLAVHDRDPALAERLLALGATWAADPAAAARGRDGIFTCLPSPAASEAVLAGILEGAAPGTTWIECSTLGRDDILRLAALAAARGIGTLEAPVTGGVHLASRGEITVLAGGDEDLFARHEAALRAMGGQLFHMGPLGSAAVIKVITNMLAFIHLVADGEALMLAKRAGLDLGQAWAAIAASSGTSFVHETEGQLILSGSYDIAFTMDLALKDLGFALGFGKEFGVPLDLATRVAATFEAGRAAYGGSAQSTQIVKLLEDRLGTDLRAAGFPARLE
ncbi:NAD(P)-dependent oxidoreductase [Amaricoccus sp.]|uniref:NAD(P)-dependent oxidoreductase n=1 Tax=Amaricoccus sp. TaxID=1872485 RepID=UPI002BABE426|nr:NAD(P)-dependent oxidoreductase [Amaricoccus sp.]HRW13972.1 NAD(P)-dependent oxidoreductase [Amaricoccus sp.]